MITLVSNFKKREEMFVARFAVVFTEQNKEEVWVFETRTEALKWFEVVRVANNLDFFEPDEDEMDDTFLESHAFGYEGQQLFVSHISTPD